MLRTAAGRSSRRGIFRRPARVYWRRRRLVPSLVPAVPPVTESGTLAAVVADVYANRTNASGDESYDVPTTQQAADMATAFSAIIAGDNSGAAALVDQYGYDVVLFTDTDNSRQYTFLRERLTATRFWGFYVWNRQADRGPLVVEAPHPKFDANTHTEAGNLFTKANGRAFLLATTHRNANAATEADGDRVSDVANYGGPNVFQSVHQVAHASATTAVQIHGYANATDTHQIIVSEGQPSPGARAQKLATDLRNSPGAFDVGVYDGVIGTALGATGNVQGQWSRAQGDRFWVHVEQNSDVRTSATLRGYVEDVIALGLPTPVGLTDSGASADPATLVTSASATDTGTGADAVGVVNIPAPPPPGQLYDLSRWHLTLPTDDGTGTAEQINQPELATYTDAHYYSESGRIVCIAPVQGATTSGASGATRSEHRERESDYSLSAWDPNTTGRRQLTITTRADGTSITGGTLPRQEVIIFQIHGASGTPPIYLTAEWTSSGTPLATPRVRMFVSGTGMANANVVTGITPTTDITLRCRVANAVLSLWVVIGQVTDLPPITATPTFTTPTANFTDQSAWYYKFGAYNKTAIDSGSTGQAEARISYYELLQPGDPDPVPARRGLFLPF